MCSRRGVWLLWVAIAALAVAAVAPVGVAPAFAVLAEPYAVQQGRLVADDAVSAPVGGAGAFFGEAVAIDGNTLVVGAPQYDKPASAFAGAIPDVGKVYVYVRSGTSWSLQASLLSPTSYPNGRFGTSVAIQGDVVVVGAPGDYTPTRGNTGAAYVFLRTGTAWSAATQLAATTSSDSDEIGQDVDIDGGTIVIGCPGDDSDRGCVRPFTGSGVSWSPAPELAGATGDRYGEAVAIAGDVLMVSASGWLSADGLHPSAGSVAVYNRISGNWAYRERIQAPVPATNAKFGGPLDLSPSGSTLLVGAPTFDGSATSAGQAYVYNRNISGSYVIAQTLANPGPNSADGDWFGSSVALDGDGSAIVGAYWDDAHKGGAYFYSWRGGAWNMVQKVDATSLPVGDPGVVGLFGEAVAFDDGTAAVGAPLANATASITQAGAAYVFNTRGVLTGICRDKVTGAPLANVEVSAYIPDSYGDPDLAEGTSLIMSDGSGRYTLILSTGQYAVGYMGLIDYWPGFYQGKSLYPDATPVSVTAGTTTTLDLYISPKIFVYRFYNFKSGTHFFTSSATERDSVITNLGHTYQYEGIAYATDPATDPYPLYRFYNYRVGSHFYTADVNERDDVIRRLGYIFSYDGPTYSVSLVPGAGKGPVYRFYNVRNGSHFYTASEAERADVQTRLGSIYQFEGPAFYINQ